MQCCFCFPRQRTETPILVCVILNLLTSFDLLTRFKGLGLTINTMGNVGTTGPHLPSTIYLGISRKSTHRCRATRIHTPRASTGSEACDFILSCSDCLNRDHFLICLSTRIHVSGLFGTPFVFLMLMHTFVNGQLPVSRQLLIM